MIETYLSQLKSLASELDVDLADACKAENIAHTTLWRWMEGESHPREDKVKAIAERMKKMHAAKRRAS